MKAKWKLILSISVVLMLISGVFIFYNTQKLKCSVDPLQVSEIDIFNGNTGKKYKITDQANIEHMVNNLNSITFVKNKSSKGYSGFSFATQIKDKSGATTFQCTINSKNTIIYHNYFYIDYTSSIDFDYIDKLLKVTTPL
ncbi:MAG TPA: hypothetical protein VHP31_08170 [Caproicibacter sp.]|nr:hypothetical protein [Caproicibacter sp.]